MAANRPLKFDQGFFFKKLYELQALTSTKNFPDEANTMPMGAQWHKVSLEPLY